MGISRDRNVCSHNLNKKEYRRKAAKILAALVTVMLFAGILAPTAVRAESSNEKTTIRVGFFEFDGYHQQDEEGNRDGYGYDFLQMIAPYANFQYEYVGYDKGWAEMLQMLQDGEIDLLTSAKKTVERAEMFEFSQKSIGSTYTMLTTHPDNKKYITADYSALEGIRVGLLKDNSRNESFKHYAQMHDFRYRPVYYDSYDEMKKALAEGKDVDAIVTSDLRTLGNEIVIDKFDEAEFYAVTKKGNTQLMEKIDDAIAHLSADSPTWLDHLADKYYNRTANGRELALNIEERHYIEELSSGGRKLRVLINPDMAPYSYFKDGVPRGIMADLLEGIAQKTGLPYEILETENTKDYLAHIQSGEADMVFDAVFNYNDAEQMGYYLTSPYYSLTCSRVTHNNDNTKNNVVAVKKFEGISAKEFAPIYEGKELLFYDTIEECMKAVRKGQADCTYVLTYTASKYVGTDYTNSFAYEIMNNVSCPVSVAVREDCGKLLYSLMNKAVCAISVEESQAAINDNIQYDVTDKGFLYFIYNEPIAVITGIILVAIIIFMLVVFFQLRERKAELRHRQRDEQQKAALRAAYEAADRASHAKSDFLSSMSHDIRTPLNAIIGMIAIATAHKDDPARVSDCLAKITSSSRHLLALINEVLDMSKIESGKVSLMEEEFNLAELLDNLVELVQPGIKAKKHELIVRIHNIDHEDVIGDSLRVQQAFVNIVSNATKYTPDGGRIEIDISELESKSPKIGVYQFVFKDNGIGMSQEYMKTIFDPFSRERDSRVDKIQGTGLGMAITKNIVQMMDGSIHVESEPDKGSTFTVVIRLKLQAKETKSIEEIIGLPVLVVDDDESICESTCLILNEIGMESEFVLSGREAVRKVTESHEKEDDYYAVIIDWLMPDMDGLATTKAIRKAVGEDVPIIIFSAYDWSDIEEEARAAGVNAFVSKPLFKSKLINTFDEIIHKDRIQEEDDALDDLGKMDFSGRHLLLVEDNELNREVACEIIGLTNIQIDVAENGEIAVEKFQQSPLGYYDFILMDVQMPVMNGYDATMAIRSLDRPDGKEVPIIAMTANAFAEDVEKALASQMNEHLAKPLDIGRLAEVMKRWICL